MQDALPPALALPDQLAAEEHDPRVLLRQADAHPIDSFDRIGRDRGGRRGIPADAARHLDIPGERLLHLAAQGADFLLPLEMTRIDDGDRHEDDVLEESGEHLLNRQEEVDPDAAEIPHQEDGRRPGRVGLASGPLDGREVEQIAIEQADLSLDGAVVGADPGAADDEDAGDHDGLPRPLAEFLNDHHGQDGQAEHKTEDVDRDVPDPVLVLAPPAEPEPAHSHLGEREGDEHIDGVHDNEDVDAAARQEQERHRRKAHQQDAVLGGQPVRQRREPVGEPGVDGHARHDARSVDEPGLGGDEQQCGLRGDGQLHEDPAERQPGGGPAGGESLGEHSVERLADLLRGRN